MHKIYYNLLDRDSVVKSETYWSHDTTQGKIEYNRFNDKKTELLKLTDIEEAEKLTSYISNLFNHLFSTFYHI